MPANPQLMQCMEVWGGSETVDTAVAMPGLDAWVYCKPYRNAVGGGDVYYVSSCATGRITRLLVADVSGHGESVRETATHLRGLMRRFVNFIDQTRFVRSMNEQFAALSAGGSFATAVVTTFFAPTNYLTLCNAGHPPPLIHRAAQGRWEILEQAGNIPLGIEEGLEYAHFGVELAVNDLVLCYTDSLIESKDASGEMLGVNGLLERVRLIDITQPEKIIANVLGKLGDVGADDVTLLLFRPNGLAPRAKLRDKLLAPIRVLGAARQRDGPTPWPEISVANLGGAVIDPLNKFWSARRQRRE